MLAERTRAWPHERQAEEMPFSSVTLSPPCGGSRGRGCCGRNCGMFTRPLPALSAESDPGACGAALGCLQAASEAGAQSLRDHCPAEGLPRSRAGGQCAPPLTDMALDQLDLGFSIAGHRSLLRPRPKPVRPDCTRQPRSNSLFWRQQAGSREATSARSLGPDLKLQKTAYGFFSYRRLSAGGGDQPRRQGHQRRGGAWAGRSAGGAAGRSVSFSAKARQRSRSASAARTKAVRSSSRASI